jgi:hypothetical protein
MLDAVLCAKSRYGHGCALSGSIRLSWLRRMTEPWMAARGGARWMATVVPARSVLPQTGWWFRPNVL